MMILRILTYVLSLSRLLGTNSSILKDIGYYQYIILNLFSSLVSKSECVACYLHSHRKLHFSPFLKSYFKNLKSSKTKAISDLPRSSYKTVN